MGRLLSGYEIKLICSLGSNVEGTFYTKLLPKLLPVLNQTIIIKSKY